jgi:hypothetical protein
MAIKIHNIHTNIVGRAKTERMVSGDLWRRELFPLICEHLEQSSRAIKHKAAIGQWVVELYGNDAHMYEFFVKNWKVADAKARPDVRCFVLNPLREREAVMTLLGLKTQGDLEAHLSSFLKAIEDKKYRASLRDEKLSNIEKYSRAEQLEIALFAPATVYSSEERSFLTLNTNYYGQLKSKSSLGPLEEYLIRKAKIEDGKIMNPEEVWMSMHAGSLEYYTAERKRRGIVIIAPTGTGKSTHVYGLVEAKPENRLHSDDWSFVNLASRKVLISENQFYMRTNIAGIYPHLIPLLVNQPLENVAFTPEMVELLERFQSSEDLARGLRDGRVAAPAYQKLIEQMVENNSARSLIDPRLMAGDKFIEETVMTDLFLMKRDYDSPMFLKKITPEEMVEIMTSKGNVFNYVYGKTDADGYGVFQSRTTEIYYNPYLCVCEVDAEKKIIGPLDQIRIEGYKTLARHPEMRLAWVNTRLPANQTQLCLRKFLENDYDLIQIEKGDAVRPEFLAALGVEKKDKPAVEGRRPLDLTGFYDSKGWEVEIAAFYTGGAVKELIAFYKPAAGEKRPDICAYAAFRVKGFERVDPRTFLQIHEPCNVKKILSF